MGQLATKNPEQKTRQRKLASLATQVESVFLGKSEAVRQALAGLLIGGHVLIEDVPGVGKTVLAKTLAQSLNCRFARLQLTPDLLPSDILGVSVYNNRTDQFEFKQGPIFANIILADEINRTTPRTQSALLEAMNEGQVSLDGTTHRLDRPFMVIATQNPFEFEGTYFLPENQLDRFTLRISIGYPAVDDELRILQEQPSTDRLENLRPILDAQDVVELQRHVNSVRIDENLQRYIIQLAEKTRGHDRLNVGVSPRGCVALMRTSQAAAMLADRTYVIPDDITNLIVPVFAHRLVSKGFMQNGHTRTVEQIMGDIIASTPVP